MRRVVVTGLGMVTPLGLRRRSLLEAHPRRQERRAQDREIRDLRSAVQDRLPDPARRRLRRHLQSRSVDGAEGAAQGRRIHPLCAQRRTSGARRFRLEAVNAGRAIRDRRDDRLRHRRRRRHCRWRDPGEGARTAPSVAVLHSRPHHQSRLRLCLDRVRAEGSEFGGGHRLLDRFACDRRCRPHDRAWRRRCDGGGRRGIADRPAVAGGLCRLPRAVDFLQRHARSVPRVPTTRIATAS